jgi:hypothetical protein
MTDHSVKLLVLYHARQNGPCQDVVDRETDLLQFQMAGGLTRHAGTGTLVKFHMERNEWKESKTFPWRSAWRK